MSRPHQFKAGESITERKLRSITDALGPLVGLDGGFSDSDWMAGAGAAGHASLRLALFELGPAWESGAGPTASPKEPLTYKKCKNSRLIYYFPTTGSYDTKPTDLDRDETVWYITPAKTSPSASAGDWVWCVFNALSGRWEMLTSPSSGGSEIINFRVLSAGTFIGEVDNFCLRVQAEVLAVSCSGASVSVGDEVTIYDPGGCQFNIPVEILLNVRGTAVKMAWNDPIPGTGTGTGTGTLGVDVQGIPYCFLQSTPEEIEAFEDAGECWWMVQSLCCVEDWYDE
jgi:hypothetical protein